ncbi:MAG TPA: dihydrodipicolinate synthase family protein [Thermomicrobiaceae bacterium]|nr:dihydrodipicolinate synthase family protein [Thermomicrobiaceae bacterium]
MEPLRGVYHILSTPFTPDGALDDASLGRLVDAVVDLGVDGITPLGVAGEAQKLTDAERRRVVEVVIQTVAGRVPVVVGTSRDGTDATVAASREAEALGAAGVMVAPPTFVGAGPALTAHYRRVAEAVSVPLVLQDYPPVNGVSLSPRAMAELVAAVPAITTIKLEDPPTGLRIAQTLALLEGSPATIIGGMGGTYFLEELRRGSSGTMTGFAYPEVLVAIWRSWRDGDRAAAASLYHRYLPLLLFEGQPKLGVAVRKEILRRRGLIAHAAVRQPATTLDEGTADLLAETLRELGIDASAGMGTPAALPPR